MHNLSLPKLKDLFWLWRWHLTGGFMRLTIIYLSLGLRLVIAIAPDYYMIPVGT